ncbi:redoxin domain-containing protein [Chitinophaga sp. GbtcB8]|uniref:TlpA family protein disulfide reductase n=1 Tax=Chitinophaga sp. GbtcB8 TaxID=2824753 RepID=UPI001C2FB989|nr:redoxin domain-containing protein [Chitinophaga sp. GbtcB8]
MKILENLLLAMVLIATYSCTNKEAIKTGMEGKELPAFELLLADSVTHFNTANSPVSKPVVLFYFSPYCPYCRAQMGDIAQKMDKLKNIQFYMFTSFPFSDMKHFYEEYKVRQYPNIQMGLDLKNFFPNYFETQVVPYTAIYGKDRKLRKVFIGQVYSSQIKAVAEN